MNTRAFCSIPIMLLLCNLCMAQHTLLVRDYLPDTGTKLQKQPVTFSEPGPSGKNRIWNFSEMKPINKPHQVTYSPIDSLMLGMGGTETIYLNWSTPNRNLNCAFLSTMETPSARFSKAQVSIVKK